MSEGPAGNKREPLIFLVAGEPSGDQLGARLIMALRKAWRDRVRFVGVGGESMAEQGLQSLFPMGELSIMGFFEVAPRIPRLLGRIRQTVSAVRETRPDALVTIDTPAFSFRVAERLRDAGLPLIHYVAPQVWAYRPERAAKIARFLDHVMVLLPFEPPYFESVGLPCSFVGHPVVEEGADGGDGNAFRAQNGLQSETPLLCALPGSRRNEISRLLPVFGETVGLLARRFPSLHVVVPTVSTVAETVSSVVSRWAVPATVVVGRHARYDAFNAATTAIAASGTVGLELAIAGVPMVITYKANPMTAFAARRMLRVPHVSLVNLILERQVVPELLQERCRPDVLCEALAPLFADDTARSRQIESTAMISARIGSGVTIPSQRAAEVVISAIERFSREGHPWSR